MRAHVLLLGQDSPLGRSATARRKRREGGARSAAPTGRQRSSGRRVGSELHARFARDPDASYGDASEAPCRGSSPGLRVPRARTCPAGRARPGPRAPHRDSPSTTTDDPDTGTVPAVGDLVSVADLIAGRATAAEVIPAVAWSGGWPVRDGDTAWFVAWSDTGPWSVAGDFDGVGAGIDVRGRWVLVGAGRRWPCPRGPAVQARRPRRQLGRGSVRAVLHLRPERRDLYVAPPTDRARLDRWPGLAGEGLAARDLRVWVPEGEGPWPVLYANDGQNLFDPGAIWGGWRLQESLATRDPMLVVGIDNTPARFDEYTHVPDDIGTGGLTGGAGDTYASSSRSTSARTSRGSTARPASTGCSGARSAG